MLGFLKKKTREHNNKVSNTHSYRFSSTNLSSWSASGRPPGHELVHAILLESSTLYTNPASELFNNWDIISMSLVDIGSVFRSAANIKARQSSSDKESWGMLSNGLYEYCKIALVLDVPVQNIVGTFDHDAWFPNNIGTKHDNRGEIRASALTDAFFSGEQRLEQINGQPKRVNFIDGGFNQIKSSHEIQRSNDSYNEILVVGRPGVNIYPNLPATGEIKVKAIYIGMTRMDFEYGKLTRDKEAERIINNAKRLQSLNGFNIPIIDPTEVYMPLSEQEYIRNGIRLSSRVTKM